MTRFVAFLRGINVGGRVVKKEQLAEAFVSLGFQDVSTFMQSGNVLFTTTNADAEALKAQIEAKLHDVLGFEVAVFIRTITQLKEIIAKVPFQNQPSGGTSYLVTLLENPAPPAFTATLPLTIPKSTAQILCANGTEIYSETHGGGEGALPNPYVESKLKVKATTRNLNVIRAIVEKCSEDQN